MMISMNKLTIQKQVQILAPLVEGNSIRSTVRMTAAAKILFSSYYVVRPILRTIPEQSHG